MTKNAFPLHATEAPLANNLAARGLRRAVAVVVVADVDEDAMERDFSRSERDALSGLPSRAAAGSLAVKRAAASLLAPPPALADIAVVHGPARAVVLDPPREGLHVSLTYGCGRARALAVLEDPGHAS